MMKKMLRISLALILCVSMLAGCGGTKNSNKSSLDPKDFESDAKFMTIADLPPNPVDEEAVQLYMDLGLDTYILTEDYTPMVYEGKVADSYKEAIESLGEKGLDVWIRNMWNDPDYFTLESAKEGSNYGSPYTMVPRDITDDFKGLEAMTGFYMSDEPYMTTLEDDPTTPADESLYAAMDQYGKLVEWKNKYYPDTYWHMNHVPSSSHDHYRGHDYEYFLQYYVDNIVSKLTSGGRSICLDRYPLPEGGGIREDFLSDVLIGAKVTRDYNQKAEEGQKATFGICLQTFQDTNAKLRDITSAEDVTFQMYTGMACGARLFEYFCYRSLEGIGLSGIVDSAGQPRIYDYVKEANDRAFPFAKVVCNFDWQGMMVSKGVANESVQNIFDSVRDLVSKENGCLKSMTSRYDAIAGRLTKGEQDGYMVVNYTAPDEKLTNIVTLNFDGCSQALVYTEDGVDTVNILDNGDLRITLAPGQGAFVIPK